MSCLPSPVAVPTMSPHGHPIHHGSIHQHHSHTTHPPPVTTYPAPPVLSMLEQKSHLSNGLEPPIKMARKELPIEDSVLVRQQQARYLDLLARLFHEQKRGVLELILKGCNGDIVQAIECVLPSHERAMQQMSTMPGQSFTLPPAPGDDSNRPRFHGHNNEKSNMPMSAFIPFSHSSQHPPQAPVNHYSMVPVTPCPPGCTCQLSQKCSCPDCQSPSSKITQLPKEGLNSSTGGAVHGHTISPVTQVSTAFLDTHTSSKDSSNVRQHPNHINVPQSPTLKPTQPGGGHRMVAYVPVSAHVPSQMQEPVKICAGCGGKMKLEDQRCPICEPSEQKQ